MVKEPYDNLRITDLFNVEEIGTVDIDGMNIDLYKLLIHDTGDIVPVAICIPNDIISPAPAVLAFSGHTHYGLRELFVDKESYQRAIAWRLCKAGFVTAALEKID